jgi:PAS domain S-box-containing protein
MKVLNENIFEIAFRNATEGLILVDEHSKIQLCNPRASELFGYQEEEILGEPIEILVPRNVREAHIKHRDAFQESPKTRTMGGMNSELMGQHKEGHLFPVEVSLNHFETHGRKLVLAFVTDITERKKQDDELMLARVELFNMNKELENIVQERTRELVKMQQLYMLIARNFPEGTINVIDRDLNYVFVEGKELFKYGMTSQLLIGTSYLERLPKAIIPALKAKLFQAFMGENSIYEVLVNKNYYELNIVGLCDEDGTISQLLIVEHNITKKRLAAIEQEKALQREREMSEMKSRFVSMASHEFRTPLSAILSSASLIEKYETTEQQPQREKHTKRIKDSVNNLNNILNDFLSLDKLSSGKVEVHFSYVNPKQLIEETLCEIEVLKRDGQTIHYRHEGSEEAFWLDEKIYKNVLINLTSNAIKYSKDDGLITIQSHQTPYDLSLKVIDNGIGIPLNEQKNIFERFFRANNVTNIQGTGLGLNIVKRYIDLMSGTIKFESAPDVETIFEVTIPIRTKKQ